MEIIFKYLTGPLISFKSSHQITVFNNYLTDDWMHDLLFYILFNSHIGMMGVWKWNALYKLEMAVSKAY